MGYATTVVEVGQEAEMFLAEGTAITFGSDAPEALRPFCFIIDKAELAGDLAVGQTLAIGDQVWTITAVGHVAQTNLANLGHVTLVFDGAAEPRLPGAVHLGGLSATPALALGVPVVFA